MTNMQYPIPKQEYKVMVQCCTYNQSQYIEDTLKGFAIQQTDFPFVCCVFDDASTDGEQEVLKRWIENHCNPEDVEVYDHPLTIILMAPDKNNPNCIYAVHLQKVNTWGKPEKQEMMSHWEKQCEYIAVCEGDDYWIDPLKLQKQVDFLNSHPNYSFCCHRFKIYQQNSDTWLNEYADKFYKENENLEITIDLFFRTWVTQPLTVIYRTDSYEQIRNELITYKYTRDVHLFYHLLKVGQGVSLNNIMGVYRWHDGGIASSISIVDKLCTGYNIYKELYLHSKDKKICKILVATGVRLIKYRGFSNETMDIINEMWSFSKGVNEKVRLILLLMTPLPIMKFISLTRDKLCVCFNRS